MAIDKYINDWKSTKNIVSRLCSRHNKGRDTDRSRVNVFNDHKLSALSQCLSQENMAEIYLSRELWWTKSRAKASIIGPEV